MEQTINYTRLYVEGYIDRIEIYSKPFQIWRYLDNSLSDPIIYTNLKDVPEPFRHAIEQRLFNSQIRFSNKETDAQQSGH